MKTFVPKAGDIRQGWWIVDADGVTLGRLSTEVAARILGKHKPDYTPFLDTGDHVIVVNASKVRLTGRKLADKIYRHHTNYPGGLKEISAEKLLAKKPERLIESAVNGMLPKGPLGRRLQRKLKVYAGATHPHEAQQPAALKIKSAARGR